MAVFAVVVSAAASLYYSGQWFDIDATNARRALSMARDGLEGTRLIRDRSWNELVIGDHGMRFINNRWEFYGTSDIAYDLTRTVTVSTEASGFKKVKSLVTWQPQPNRPQQIELVAVFSPLSQGLIGDWTNPIVVGSADVGPGGQATDVFYFNKKIYLTSSAASVVKPDFFIFDVTNPMSPVKQSELNIEQGLKSVSGLGNYAYVIEEDSSDFFIIDVSDPSAPVKKSKLTLNSVQGKYVMVKGNYVYATTANNTTGPEFYVINVLDPLSPSVVASLEIGGDVNEVNILQNTAYLATAIATSELKLVSISDPLNPSIISSYDAAGTAAGLAVHAKSPGRVYLGRAQSSNHELLVIDAINPASLSLRGSIDISSSVNSVTTTATLSFLSTSDPNAEFQVYFVRNPANMTQYGTLNFPNYATGSTYNENHVYMSVRSNDALQIVSSSP